MKLGWSRAFEDPISLPPGRQLVTLKDAAACYCSSAVSTAASI
jgi:hypothetical protein